MKFDLPDPWPFDQPPNCFVLTTTQVLIDKEDITHVFHDEDDHGWQFHYPGDKTTDDAMVIALEEIIHYDPTVIEISDLLPGWVAIRESLGKPWKRKKNI